MQILSISVRSLLAIDIHAHYGPYNRGESAILLNRFMSGDMATVLSRAHNANIEWSVVSPLVALFPQGSPDAMAGNVEAARVVEQIPSLLQWVVINPLQPSTFEQAREQLAHPKCVGIKIHPEEHCYRISDHGKKIFEFASQNDSVILTHSGQPNSMPADFVPFADSFPDVKLILAHLGNADDSNTFDLQTRAIQASKHGNIYTDTSSARSLFPGLIEWAVGEVGDEYILFGTDSPLHFTSAQRARIDYADITDLQKRSILRDNAKRLLSLDKIMQNQ